MGTCCQTDFSDEDEQLLDEAEGRTGRMQEELYQRLFEENREIFQRIDEDLKEWSTKEVFFESDPEGREALLKSGLFGKFSPEEIDAIEKERAQQEVVSFRTLSGEFEIRQAPGSNLPIGEVKRIYREETPQCVIQNMRGVGYVNKVKEAVGKDGRKSVILGEHYSFQPETRGSHEKKSEIFIYKHPKGIILHGDPADTKQMLAKKERETHYHEIGEEIHDTHLTVEENQECDKVYQEAVKGGWAGVISDHSDPTAFEYFCDAHAMFKTNPQGLKSIDKAMFKFIQSKVISLEVKDTFASLEGKEDKEEDQNNE